MVRSSAFISFCLVYLLSPILLLSSLIFKVRVACLMQNFQLIFLDSILLDELILLLVLLLFTSQLFTTWGFPVILEQVLLKMIMLRGLSFYIFLCCKVLINFLFVSLLTDQIIVLPCNPCWGVVCSCPMDNYWNGRSNIAIFLNGYVSSLAISRIMCRISALMEVSSKPFLC